MKISTGSAIAAAWLCVSAPVCAQDPVNDGQYPGANDRLEQIIVTAQKREEQLRDVPVSVTTLSGEKLQSANLTRISELESYVPNLTVTESGIGTLLFMRGMGSGINQGFEQSVGTYVDGVYRGRAQQSRIPFLDLQRVEVLRGSQSTLFGKHTIAGALNITTAKPTPYFDAEVNTIYEPQFDNQVVTGFVSGPLSGTVNGRLALYARETDGFMRNLTLDRDEAQRTERAIRGSLDWMPSPDLTVNFKAETSRFDSIGRELEITGDNVALAGPFTGMNFGTVMGIFGQDAGVNNSSLDFQRSANGDFSNNRADEFVITSEYTGWGNLSFTSITAWSQYEYDELCDCDYTGADIFSVSFRENFEQLSQEFRLASPRGGTMDYLVGLSFHDSKLNFFDTINITPQSVLVPVVNMKTASTMGSLIANTTTPRSFNQDSQNLDLFGQLTWYAGTDTRVTLGGRLASERKQGFRQLTISGAGFEPLPATIEPVVQAVYGGVFNVSNHELSGKRDRTVFLPSINVQHDINTDTMVYASVSRGEKSGGYDARSNNSPAAGGSFEFDDEIADSIELGVKMSLADGRAELNTALYYTQFDRMQVSTFDGVLGFNVGNAARSVASGLELDGRWRINEKFSLSGSLAFSDFEFKEFAGQCYFGQSPDAADGVNCDYRGRSNQFVADYSGRLTSDYRTQLSNQWRLGMTLDVIFSDDYLLTATQDPRAVQAAYTKVNGRFAVTSPGENWELALIGHNLGDEKIQSFGGDVPLAGSSFGTPGYYGFVMPGRSVSLQAVYRY